MVGAEPMGQRSGRDAGHGLLGCGPHRIVVGPLADLSGGCRDVPDLDLLDPLDGHITIPSDRTNGFVSPSGWGRTTQNTSPSRRGPLFGRPRMRLRRFRKRLQLLDRHIGDSSSSPHSRSGSASSTLKTRFRISFALRGVASASATVGSIGCLCLRDRQAHDSQVDLVDGPALPCRDATVPAVHPMVSPHNSRGRIIGCGWIQIPARCRA